MQKKLRIMFFLIASILAVQTAYASSVTITDLGTLPGGSNSLAYDINDKGQIVGSSNDANDSTHAVLWQNGVMTDLDLGGSYSYANGINDNGQIVGYGNNTLLWQNGVITDLETLDPTDINNKGQIVGSSSNPTDLSDHAVLWQNGVITDLGTNGWECSYASGINDNGQIVGYTHIMATASEAFLWQNGVITDLETLPGGDHSEANDINDNGQIVGSSNNANSDSHAVLWQNGVITDLDPSGSYSYANGINDKRQIVGSSLNLTDHSEHAVLWQNGVITDLGTLPGDSKSYPTSINNNGQIVGYSYNTIYDGHAVLWTVTATPVPPKASFTSNVTNGNAPLTVQFTDLSKNTTVWNWNFGDKSTSTSKSPTHKYTKAGKYTVSLTVKNAAGTNTKTKTNYITVTNPVKPVATFSAYPTSGKAPLTVKFTDKSTGSPTSWSWNFGDKSTSTSKSPTHKYTKTGKYTVSLTVKNAAGSNTAKKTSFITVK